MTSRPLMQSGIASLEAMFSESPADLKVLASLQDELKHRQVPRALALLQKVEKALRPSVPACPVVLSSTPDVTQSAMSPEQVPLTEILKRHRSLTASKQPALWAEHEMAVPHLLAPAGLAEPVRVVIPASAPSADSIAFPTSKLGSAMDSATHMSLSDAYQRLEATSATVWETLEAVRRRIVEQSHPEALSAVSEKKRLAIVIDAKKANIAYEIIRIARVPDFR